MTTYVVRRLLISIPVLFGIILAVFAITRILPGDACQVLLGERANQAACNAFNQAHGLDKPSSSSSGPTSPVCSRAISERRSERRVRSVRCSSSGSR
jgi:ABC-type dipeptide/oligopeptide/nickel transport system permease component